MACSLKMDVSLYGTVAVRDVEVRRSREILVPAAPSSSSMPWSGLSGDDPLSYLREIGDRIAAILDPNHDDSGVGTGDGSGDAPAGRRRRHRRWLWRWRGVLGVGSGVGSVGIGDGEEKQAAGSTDGDNEEEDRAREGDLRQARATSSTSGCRCTNPDCTSLRVQVPALEAETSVASATPRRTGRCSATTTRPAPCGTSSEWR